MSRRSGSHRGPYGPETAVMLWAATIFMALSTLTGISLVI